MNFNKTGDVITHKRLKGEWVVVAEFMSGGGTAMFNDTYPDGHTIRIMKLKRGNQIDWSVKPKEFYQSGCFTDSAMLMNPKLVRKLT